MLWPYLEATPIYQWIDFHQPWDSLRNAPYFRFKNAVFVNPSIADETAEFAFGLAHYSANSHLLAANSSVGLSDIENQSNAFMAAELGGDFIPWGGPYNWRPLTSLNATPRTYGRPENIGGNFLMVDGSVRWINPDVSTDVLDALRGPDLAGAAAAGLTITRPKSFPVPPDALRMSGVDFGDHRYGPGMRNNQGQLVELSLEGGKGGRDAHDADLARLGEFSHLVKLHLSGDFTNDGLRTVARIASLEELGLRSDAITDDGLLVLAELTLLKRLTVSGKQITDDGIDALRERMPACTIDRYGH
jgi:prepilin-type processing-associated H-X9-DG protein